MAKYKQSAWLLTWDWGGGDHAALEDKVAAILPPRLSRRVGVIMQTLYNNLALWPEEIADFCRHPHRVQWRDNDHAWCDGNPSLHANHVR